VEDCSQAHGALYRGKRVGTLGILGTFSLYPTKNLGTFGDGGIISTNDSTLAERITALRQYGWTRRSVSDLPGVNSRLDEVHAAVLLVKLSSLDGQNRRRQAIAATYDEALKPLAVGLPKRRPGCEHVFHQYVIRTSERAELMSYLAAAGITTGIHYPLPVHLQPAYVGRVVLGPSNCRATEDAAEQVLSLPMFPQLTSKDIERVITAMGDALKEGGRVH
jgi:dTDP-4-amino-4,6-dideoxygalactose transaminase